MVVSSILEYNDEETHKNWDIRQKPCGYNRIYYVQGGIAFYEDSNHSFTFEKGRLYILPTKTEYRLHQDESRKLDHIYLHAVTHPSIDFLVSIDIKKSSPAEDLVMLLKKNIHFFNRDSLCKILEIIINLALDENEVSLSPNLAFDDAKKYIDQNLHKNLSIKSICSHINLDESYFIRVFKHIWGISPKQYIIDRKLEISVGYLKSGLSIKETCLRIGYDNSDSFAYAFKKKYGIAPHEYQKQNQ